MIARAAFLMEDFAERFAVICYPSFRLFPSFSTSAPFLKICKFWSWQGFSDCLEPFFTFLSENFTSTCHPVTAVTAVTAQVGHNTQSPVPGTHQQPADKKRQMPLSRSKIRTHRSVFEFHYRSMQIHTHREKHSEWDLRSREGFAASLHLKYGVKTEIIF